MKIFVYSFLVAVVPSIAAGEGNLRGDDNDTKPDVNRILQDPLPLPPPFGEGTLDEMPPALENICDQYTDTEVHGLCVAYCESKDCDSVPHPTSPRADNKGVQKSCANLKTKFMELTGETPPCDGRCPCWELSDLQALPSDINTCDVLISYSGQYQSATAAKGRRPYFGVEGNDAYGYYSCLTQGEHVEQPNPGSDFLILDLTPDTLVVCMEEIKEYCESLWSPPVQW